jgi:hypothetical protein
MLQRQYANSNREVQTSIQQLTEQLNVIVSRVGHAKQNEAQMREMLVRYY